MHTIHLHKYTDTHTHAHTSDIAAEIELAKMYKEARAVIYIHTTLTERSSSSSRRQTLNSQTYTASTHFISNRIYELNSQKYGFTDVVVCKQPVMLCVTLHLSHFTKRTTTYTLRERDSDTDTTHKIKTTSLVIRTFVDRHMYVHTHTLMKANRWTSLPEHRWVRERTRYCLTNVTFYTCNRQAQEIEKWDCTIYTLLYYR